MWKGEAPTDEDQKFWNDTQSQTPTWAFFRRLEVSPEDLQIQLDTERATTHGLQELFADADEATVTEKDGIQRFSLTFDLTKGDKAVVGKQPWWRRIFYRRQRSG